MNTILWLGVGFLILACLSMAYCIGGFFINSLNPKDDYVKILASRLEKSGSKILGKDLNDPEICKAIIEAQDNVEKGVFVEWVDYETLSEQKARDCARKLSKELLEARQEIARLNDELMRVKIRARAREFGRRLLNMRRVGDERG